VNLDNAGSSSLHFLHHLSVTKLVLGEGFNVSDRLASSGLADKLNFVAFNFLDSEDFEFGQEVKREVVYGITKNRFLNKQNVATALFDVLAQV